MAVTASAPSEIQSAAVATVTATRFLPTPPFPIAKPMAPRRAILRDAPRAILVPSNHADGASSSYEKLSANFAKESQADWRGRVVSEMSRFNQVAKRQISGAEVMTQEKVRG